MHLDPVLAGAHADHLNSFLAPSPWRVRREELRSTHVLSAQAVRALIEEFPEQLKLSGETEDGEKTWFGLGECPFKSAAHEGQNVGKGKSALVLSSECFGFSCFSDDCRDHTIFCVTYTVKLVDGRRRRSGRMTGTSRRRSGASASRRPTTRTSDL
jgi:hypothetical protein